MREGIHQDQQRKISTLKSAPNAIHSTQDSRNLQELTDVSISSTRSTALTNSTQVNMVKDKVEVYLISTFF